jgi:hypothetical protein
MGLALLATGAAGAQTLDEVSYVVRAEGTLASGAQFGAVATGPLWGPLAAGGFVYSAPGRQIQGAWKPYPLALTFGEGIPGGFFAVRFDGSMNGRPVVGWLTILDEAPDPADAVLLTVFDSQSGQLFRENSRLSNGGAILITGPEALEVSDTLYSVLFATFSSNWTLPAGSKIELYHAPLGTFGFDLGVQKETVVEWTPNDQGGVIAFTPGSARLDFHDFTLFGLHLAGPRLPADLWLAKVTLAAGAVTIEGSLDADGGQPRRYEIAGNTVAVYDGAGGLLEQWKIVK